jgi:hypothetical protein
MVQSHPQRRLAITTVSGRGEDPHTTITLTMAKLRLKSGIGTPPDRGQVDATEGPTRRQVLDGPSPRGEHGVRWR